MARSQLLPKISEPQLVDPFSKKGSLALFWLLAQRGMAPAGNPIEFSINQIARDVGVMPFTVQRVVHTLEYDGIIRSRGLGTKKRFYLANPKGLLIRWIRHYQFQRKCKLWKFALSDSKKFENHQKEFFGSRVVPALHTAAHMVFHSGVANLTSVEGYLLDPEALAVLTRKFGMMEQERGYEVLLVAPYYQGVVERFRKNPNDPIWKQAFAVLSFLDLYSFPIRGREQAEALFRKIPSLKSLGAWSEFETIESN